MKALSIEATQKILYLIITFKVVNYSCKQLNQATLRISLKTATSLTWAFKGICYAYLIHCEYQSAGMIIQCWVE